MARQSLSGNKLGIIVAILLVVGVVAAGIAVQHSTQYQQHASSYNDLNSAVDITETNNPDGTMGPADYTQNFSNTLPSAYLGTLNFQVTDPSQGHRPTDVPVTITIPAHTLPTQAQGNGQGNNNGQGNGNQPSTTPGNSTNAGGPQTVKSLVLTITKVEVHLAYLAIPGERITPPVSPEDQTHGRPTTSPSPKTNQDVDKWEVLNIGGTQVVDLVQLANSKSFSSLGLTNLAGGLYTEVRLYVSKATATLSDGTQVTLTIPGRANIVRVVEPFTIVSGKTTTLSMDFDAQNSVIKAGDVYFLKPVVAHFNQQNQH